jgi:2-amino-4-hydroxy-6-hydroxymethyldihydropteridine diphosphokinase
LVEAVIALGSNLGDREDNLRRAVAEIARGAALVAVSSVYETQPMYREDQGWFLNCVVVVETDLGPARLLARLGEIEKKIGRDRKAGRNAPRTIDLDILFYGDEVLSGPTLTVPHPRISERGFVLVPLAEVRPGIVHPVLKKSAAAMLDGLATDKKVVKRPGSHADLLPSRPPRRGRPEESRRRRGSSPGERRSSPRSR